MSKIFPDGKIEDGNDGAVGSRAVKEQQARKYLEANEEEDRGDHPRAAWGNPKDEENAKNDEDIDRRKDDEKNLVNHHNHHLNNSSGAGGEKDVEAGVDIPSNNEPPPPLEKTSSYVETVDLLFRRAKNDIDALSQYMATSENEEVLLTVTEILFKPYSPKLKAFASFFWLCQFTTLIALFWSLLPCPDQEIEWSVVIGLPLCCGYGGIESFHNMLRFIHLRKKFPLLVSLISVNAVLQLFCVGVVMGKSVGLLDLISNFIGVAIVLQVDELLAQYMKIKDIEPKLLSGGSWKTKMLLSSKLMLIVLCGLLVYLVTLAVWYTDKWSCFNKTGSNA